MSVALQNDQYVPSRPDSLTWGWFPTDAPPVLTIQSGETVRIDTLSHAGATQETQPEVSLGELGVEPDEILKDVLDFWASREERPRDGRSGHVITGPVYIDGAEPGDMLEVEILALQTRVPYGINNTGPTSGVFGSSYPGARPNDPVLDILRNRHLISELRWSMARRSHCSRTRYMCHSPPSWALWLSHPKTPPLDNPA